MRLLLLGGTEYVGRALAEDAVRRGWEVTVFHRGKHGPPEGVRALHGDRTAPEGLTPLREGEWDAVVDTWAGAPRVVRDAARLLAGRASHYTYISSLSVHPLPHPPGVNEDSPVIDASPDSDDGEDYARAKRGGELAALDAFGDRALLARAGLVLGPWENVGRLPWWLGRIARGGTVPAPGPRELPVQFIDVRDLAAWVLDATERGLAGPYGLVAPPGHTTMGEFLDACVRATGSGAQLRWTAPESVLAAGVEPWTDLPVWVPPESELHACLHTTDTSKARAAGLRCRPAEETVAGTWAWMRSLDGPPPLRPHGPRHGLSASQEEALLRAG
ncbi:NAD-dependent epimerase/dehydratase family protein [Streptomyces sp. ODS28]|uniref:NAD-dependent epimerase/dehydratase family protein n=1 Tax=Streptomyces sp. ODS28 TaxID=3136688 RepID=UPI0031E4E9D8